MKELEKDIEQGSLRPVYLIYGPEDFLRQQCKNRLISALGGPDAPNFTYREGPATDEEEIRLLAGTVPFLAEKRLILLENTGWAKKGGQGLAEDLETLPDSTVLALVEREADAKSPLCKAVAARGRLVACRAPGEVDIKAAMKKAFEEEGYSIDDGTLGLFITRCGQELSRLNGEKEKLLAYCLDSKTVRPEDVEAITHQALRDKVFDMVNAMTEGNPGKAFRLYGDLKALKESPAKMMALILSQAARLYIIRELDEKGLSMKEMEQMTGYSPYAIRKSLGACRAFSSRSWRQKWERLLDYQLATRRGRLEDSLAVELALVEMSLR